MAKFGKKKYKRKSGVLIARKVEECNYELDDERGSLKLKSGEVCLVNCPDCGFVNLIVWVGLPPRKGHKLYCGNIVRRPKVVKPHQMSMDSKAMVLAGLIKRVIIEE